MAERPVFEVIFEAPFHRAVNVEFVWNKGLNINQRRKNVIAVHNAYKDICPQKKVLEISSKSLQAEGLPLSAFRLQKFVPSQGKNIAVENLYQGGKIFEKGGPFTDMYELTAMGAKKDERLHTSGVVKGFFFEGRIFPAQYYDAFYNWLYINALTENPEAAAPLLDYDAFTDIVFNPKKGKSCQAKSAAIFTALSKLNKLDAVKDFDEFIRTVYEKNERITPQQAPLVY